MKSDIEWPKNLKWTPPYFTFRFWLYQDYLCFDLIFQPEPHVSSFQIGIVILNGIHKKWLVLDQFHRNTQIIRSVRFETRVVKKGSVCDRSDQNLGFEAQGPFCLFEAQGPEKNKFPNLVNFGMYDDYDCFYYFQK